MALVSQDIDVGIVGFHRGMSRHRETSSRELVCKRDRKYSPTQVAYKNPCLTTPLFVLLYSSSCLGAGGGSNREGLCGKGSAKMVRNLNLHRWSLFGCATCICLRSETLWKNAASI